MENVVTKGAKSADPMPKLSLTTPGQTGSYEDLGGSLLLRTQNQMMIQTN